MTQTCAVTGKSFSPNKLRPLTALPPQIADILRSTHPELNPDSLISTEVLNEARLDYVRHLLQSQLGDLNQLDEEVLQSLHRQELLSEHPDSEDEEEGQLTLGEKLSDKLAEFGGSWTFILAFGGFMACWILLNVVLLADRGYDPYPFILLNLILSCLASLQAPVIMMSQNRQESRDRKRAENDYKINLKAELEIRHLHDKMDYMLHQQATRLMEVQQIQIELLREMAKGSSYRQGS
ncbi:DUF1003 domain-containing protein [Prosthecobacter dejongeii]|uniref:Putative membrane protein n=1 Tax=Prosthecobacter dejongeii TaxID=48465 RepID=A0A7W7YLP1_9BACT|nr:DUF1003 domain-containing protein [Prosthecobacter dejongeii]MBB5038513.1 putative membrane protein [Prosthecobacter dejongeii]